MKSMWDSERQYGSDSSGEGGISQSSHKMDPHEKRHAENSPCTLTLDDGLDTQDTVQDTYRGKENKGTDMETPAVSRAGNHVVVGPKRDSNTQVKSFIAGGEELLVAK
jgi:hypothetical protein